MAATVKTVVEGVYPFVPDGLVVGPDAMGVDYATCIDGISVHILLPNLSSDATVRAIDRKVIAPEFGFLPASDKEWGFVTSGHLSSLIESVGLRFEGDGDEAALAELGRRIDAAFDDWWSLTAGWIDCYTELDMLSHGDRSMKMGMKLRFELPTGKVLSWMTTSTASLPRPIMIPDRQDLQRCFALAGTGTALPDMWAHLREARSWSEGEQYRRAVIDAATAAEIALAEHARGLTGGGAMVEAALNICHGLGDLIDLVEPMAPAGSLPSRKKVKDQLARVRNEAVHAGISPDPTQTDRALTVATNLVEAALPLSELHVRGDAALAALPT